MLVVVVEEKVVVMKEELEVVAEVVVLVAELVVVVVFVPEKRWELDRPLSKCHFCAMDLPPHAIIFF